MPFEFGRSPGAAEVRIDPARCSACGLCARVCKGGPLRLEAGRVRVASEGAFACIACGQCVAACPTGAVSVSGRDLFLEDLVPVPPPEARAGFEALRARMLARRSVRDFLPKEVDRADVERILEAASTAPMGIPPSEVGVLVVHGRERVGAFETELRGALASMRRWLVPPLFWLFAPFVPKEDRVLLREFVVPAADRILAEAGAGKEWLLYGAPLVLHFYGTPYADPADPAIAAIHAMLAAESLDLGTCLLGFPGPILQRSAGLQKKHALPKRMRPGLGVAVGHPAVAYRRAIRRRFAGVRWA